MPALNFNANDHQPLGSIEAVPSGWYPVKITKSEFKENSQKTGRYLELTATITDGDYKGGMLITRLNLENPNSTAVEIAQRTLSSICHAIHVHKITKTEQLHNHTHMWKAVYIEPVTDEDGKVIYGAKNDIKAYRESTELPGRTVEDDDAPAWVTEDMPAPAPEEPKPAPAPAPKAKAKVNPKAVPVPSTNDGVPPPDAPPADNVPSQTDVPALSEEKGIDTDFDSYMTAKAGGASYLAFAKKGWTIESLVKAGYMRDPGIGNKTVIPDVPPPSEPTDATSTSSAKPPWVP
jgi:hypothetical protein